MSEAVVSTRIRLARNLKDYPFPIRLSAEKAREIVDKVGEALSDSELKFHRIDLDSIPDTIRVAMIERHLVSPDFISTNDGRAVYLSDDNTVSIMNLTDQPIPVARVFYKTYYAEQDTFIGGITYTVEVKNLPANGSSGAISPSHFSSEMSRFVGSGVYES
jgi:hypothetical protein